MTDLLSVLTIAKRLNIPESTCRYYCRQYADFLPSVGDGRGKRYKEGAIEVLQIIVDMAKDNRSSTDIASHLRQQFPVNIPSSSDHYQQPLTSYYQGSQADLPAIFKDFLTLHAEIINKSLLKDQALIEKDKDLAAVRSALDANSAELDQARETISKARNELQRLLQVKQDAEQKAKVVLDQQEELKAREIELEDLRAEVGRLSRPWWRRWFGKQ
jgi:DNA-binding transcriptional MerR regulator